MKILHALLFAPKLSSKGESGAGALKGHNSESLFVNVLLNFLKEKGKTDNTCHNLPLKEHLYLPLPSLQDYKSDSANLYAGKPHTISVNFPEKLIRKEKEVALDKKYKLGIPLKEKSIFVKYKLTRWFSNGKSRVFPVPKVKLKKGVLSLSAVRKERGIPIFAYRPLKKLSPAKPQLKLFKNRSEQPFKLGKDQVRLEGAPSNLGHFFGVAPAQIVNHRLVVTVKSSKGKTFVLKGQTENVHFKTITFEKRGTSEPIKTLNKFKSEDLEKDDFPLKNRHLVKKSEYKLSTDKIHFSTNQKKAADERKIPANEQLLDKNSPLLAFKNEVRVEKLPNLEKSFLLKLPPSSLKGKQNEFFTPVNVSKFHAKPENRDLSLQFRKKTVFMKVKYRAGVSKFSFKSDRKFRIIGDTKSSFPPGKYPALKRAVVDRSFPSPVHLFSVNFENPQPLLSDNSSQFQHRFHSGGSSTLYDTSLSTVSFSYLPEHSSDGRSDSNSGFSDGLDQSPHFQDFRKDTDFHISYVDRNLKLLATVRGKVLSLNLNLLGNVQLDPSTLRDITAVIENSGFIPGKITLKQRKGRYTLSPEEASKKLELKV